jgi:hypothetical protein
MSYEDICTIVSKNNSPRTRIVDIDRINPLPMPECRLNEWIAMLNVEYYKEITIPRGFISLFRAMDLDIGTAFYRECILGNHKFKNMNEESFAIHAPFSKCNMGNPALFNETLYFEQEKMAKKYLVESDYLMANFD